MGLTLKQADEALKRKLAELKAKKSQDEMIGLIVLMGEKMSEDIQEAIDRVKIVVPKIDMPEIPEIKIPEIVVPKMDPIEVKIPEIVVPKPEVTVNVPPIKVPKPEVTVNVKAPIVKVDAPVVNVPEFPKMSILPPYDSGRVTYKLDPTAEVWTLSMGEKDVAEVIITYFDKDMYNMSGFKIKLL